MAYLIVLRKSAGKDIDVFLTDSFINPIDFASPSRVPPLMEGTCVYSG